MEMPRQNHIGTKARAIMITMPAAKRYICGSAQVSTLPPATETSIRNPIEATAAIRKTSGQFRYRILRMPVGVWATE